MTIILVVLVGLCGIFLLFRLTHDFALEHRQEYKINIDNK